MIFIDPDCEQPGAHTPGQAAQALDDAHARVDAARDNVTNGCTRDDLGRALDEIAVGRAALRAPARTATNVPHDDARDWGRAVSYTRSVLRRAGHPTSGDIAADVERALAAQRKSGALGDGVDDSEVVAFLAADAAYWREQHRNLAERQRKALNVLTHGEAYHFDEHQLGRNPPEPPVGTVYAEPDDGGIHAWTRRDDGWHCPRDECTNCPCGWGEVLAWRGGIDRLTRYLPGELPARDTEVPF